MANIESKIKDVKRKVKTRGRSRFQRIITMSFLFEEPLICRMDKSSRSCLGQNLLELFHGENVRNNFLKMAWDGLTARSALGQDVIDFFPRQNGAAPATVETPEAASFLDGRRGGEYQSSAREIKRTIELNDLHSTRIVEHKHLFD